MSEHHDSEAVVPVRAGGLRVMRLAVLMNTAAIVVLAVLLVVAFSLNRSQAMSNCQRIHRLVQAGGNLIGGSPDRLRALRESGRITQTQFENGVGWYRADCVAR